MNILALADRPVDLDFDALIAEHDIEAIVGLGDLDERTLDALRGVAVPVLGVYGNHDRPYMPDLGIIDCHLKTVPVHGIRFTGFEGCVRYKDDGDFQYTQQEASELAALLSPADVLLCHCPPYGINDDPDDPAHTGFVALRDYVRRHQPSYVLHGHTYPRAGHVMQRHGDTEIVYVHGHRIVSLDVDSYRPPHHPALLHAPADRDAWAHAAPPDPETDTVAAPVLEAVSVDGVPVVDGEIVDVTDLTEPIA